MSSQRVLTIIADNPKAATVIAFYATNEVGAVVDTIMPYEGDVITKRLTHTGEPETGVVKKKRAYKKGKKKRGPKPGTKHSYNVSDTGFY